MDTILVEIKEPYQYIWKGRAGLIGRQTGKSIWGLIRGEDLLLDLWHKRSNAVYESGAYKLGDKALIWADLDMHVAGWMYSVQTKYQEGIRA